MTTQTAYLIKLGQYIDAGFLEKMGTDVATIESIVRDAILNGDANITAKSIVDIKIDLLMMWVEVTYIDQWDIEERETLFLGKLEVCFASQ